MRPRDAKGLGARSGGVLDAPRTSFSMRTQALMYHDIVDGDPDQSGFAGAGPAGYKLTTARFRAHLDAIGNALNDPPGVLDHLLAGRSETNAWMLTFDDGGATALGAGGAPRPRRGPWPD